MNEHDERPSTVECSGPDLSRVLADLQQRGGTVATLTAVCVGRWRLAVQWPEPSQAALPLDAQEQGNA